MKLKKNSLGVKIWLYLCLFSLLILAFLWLFQVLFLNTYYEWVKSKQIRTLAADLRSQYKNNDWTELLDDMAYEKGICIEVSKDGRTIYTSSAFNRGCMINSDRNPSILYYKNDFIESGKRKKEYELINPALNNKTLLYGIKLDQDTYGFISASLEPLDEGARIIKSQLIYVSVGVFLLSLVIGYVLSKKLSKPIVKVNKTALKMAEGDYDIVFETEEDIDEINQLVKTLNHAKDELSKTEELRRDLLANVGHDLKTPLTMIKAYAEMVRDLTYNKKQKRIQNCNVIIEEADRMTGLVNDIVDLSQLQSRVLEMHMERFNITELVYTILKRYDILKEKENLKFVFDEKNDYYVYADKKKLEQVIYNLLNNAINYTGEDNTVTIRLIPKENVIRVEISDTGKGIKEEDLPHIWDRYYKNSKKHKRNAVGTGIGLSIVKNILINHHFEYGVISKKGKGTTFYFEAKRN